jgi:hypothetical protein
MVNMLRNDDQMLRLLMGNSWDYPIYFTATTNKAAQVLSSMVGEDASTIHRLFGLRPINNYKTGDIELVRGRDYKQISKSLILIDEASMVDDALLAEIRASTQQCKLLFIGDPTQLTPVNSKTCPALDIPNSILLTTPHRQNEDSPILTIANSFKSAVRTGIFPRLTSIGTDVHWVDVATFEAEICKAFLSDIDTKIITWTNQKTIRYNTYIRKLLGHSKSYTVGEYLIANSPIIIRNKVMCKTDELVRISNVVPSTLHGLPGSELEIDNNYRVFLPDSLADAASIVKGYAKKKMWEEHFKYKELFTDLRPPYASTVFKVQGATHHTVFVDVNDISKSTYDNQIARMMHVAVSRATDKVYMHGNLPKRLYE